MKTLDLPKEIILKDDGRYYKKCPTCNEEQSYLRKNYAIESFKLKKECKKCTNKKPSNNQHAGWYKGVLRKSFAHKYKINAKLRDIEWNVSFDYLADLLIKQDFKCALTNRNINAMKVCNNASLDRIDSNLGYVEGNIQWVTSKVNMMKQNYSQQDFISICIDIAKNIKK
jgi:hypothetical protein